MLHCNGIVQGTRRRVDVPSVNPIASMQEMSIRALADVAKEVQAKLPRNRGLVPSDG